MWDKWQTKTVEVMAAFHFSLWTAEIKDMWKSQAWKYSEQCLVYSTFVNVDEFADLFLLHTDISESSEPWHYIYVCVGEHKGELYICVIIR